MTSRYDQWLEQPYEDQAREEEKFEAYWEAYAHKIINTIKTEISETFPDQDYQHLCSRFYPLVKDLSEDVLARWAHNLDDAIPSYESWCESH